MRPRVIRTNNAIPAPAARSASWYVGKITMHEDPTFNMQPGVHRAIAYEIKATTQTVFSCQVAYVENTKYSNAGRPALQRAATNTSCVQLHMK